MTNEHNGLLVLDKPSGITSRDAVNRAQEWFPPRTPIGHTGTLDPLAAGVLVLCVGGATRLAEYVQEMDKTYRTTLVLGARSDTDDADGRIASVPDAAVVDDAALRTALAGFVGEIEQTPPAYSAIKIGGKRAHQLARRGGRVDITPRRVSVYAIDLLRYEWPELDLEIRCGKGTYIRSLARDLGERLKCGAYVKTLRRTRVGAFSVEQAISLEATAGEAHAHLLPLAKAVAHLPQMHLTGDQIERLRHGQSVRVDAADAPLCAIGDSGGNLVAIAAVREGILRPVKNFSGN